MTIKIVWHYDVIVRFIDEETAKVYFTSTDANEAHKVKRELNETKMAFIRSLSILDRSEIVKK